jgi:hypothetical protein
MRTRSGRATIPRRFLGRGIPTTTADPLAALRSRSYLVLLVFAAIIGVPISAASYGFLQLANHLQRWVFTDLPSGLGFERAPTWWPLAGVVDRRTRAGQHRPAQQRPPTRNEQSHRYPSSPAVSRPLIAHRPRGRGLGQRPRGSGPA